MAKQKTPRANAPEKLRGQFDRLLRTPDVAVGALGVPVTVVVMRVRKRPKNGDALESRRFHRVLDMSHGAATNDNPSISFFGFLIQFSAR
jgi:hypothetical protein